MHSDITQSALPMKFVSTDGSVFTDRGLYRKHEMETQYTFRDKKSEVRVHSYSTL